MPEGVPTFWSVALRLIPAWFGSGLALTVVMYSVIGLAGGSDDEIHGPWAFGTDPLELLASVPFALLGLVLLTVLTRWVLPEPDDGRRPAWIPLALVLGVTAGLATLPPFALDLGAGFSWAPASEDSSGGGVVLWLVAAALIRRIPWRAPQEARAPLPRRRLPVTVLGGAAGLAMLLAPPFAYASFHPVVLNQGQCGDGGCSAGGRPYLSLQLARHSGAPVELRAIEAEGAPRGTHVVVERWVEGVYEVGEDRVRPVRLPVTLPSHDALSRSFDVRVVLEADDRTACSRSSAPITHVRLRYVVRGRETTDRRKLKEPTELRAACPQRR